MHKYILPVLLVLATLMSGCYQSELKQAVISGSIKGQTNIAQLELNRVENGELSVLSTIHLKGGDTFGFITDVTKPGMYVITLLDANGRKLVTDHYLNRFYLTNDEHITIELDEDGYQLVSAQLNENNVLNAWNQNVDTLFTFAYPFQRSSTFEEFFPLLPEYQTQAEAFKAELDTDNSHFNQLMRYVVDADVAMAALMHVFTPHPKHPEKSDFTPYFQNLISKDWFATTQVLNFPTGRTLLNLQTKLWHRLTHDKPTRDEMKMYFETLRNHVSNDTLKGYMALNELVHYKSYDESFISFKNKVQDYMLNQYLEGQFKQHELSIRTFGVGAKGFNFKGTDINGNQVALNDFYGKLVYVDVWATWCGPCKKEIPELKKLEKAYHGKDIMFVSYSVDEPKDKEKWKKFVKDNGLRGVQLVGDNGFGSDIAQAYGITTIPRFMLFDKEGKVISTDVARPSNPNIQAILNKYLRK